MVSRLSRLVWGLASLALLAACAGEEQKKKFNLSNRHQDRQLIVTFTEGTQRSFARAQLLAADTHSGALNDASYLIKYDSDVDLEKKAEALAATPGVRSVEANVVYTLYEKTPDDTDFSKLYAMSNVGQSSGVAGADIGATKAWDETTGSKSVLVGIIDSGVDYTHPDLAGNIWNNPGETGLDAAGNDKRFNGIDDDGNGFVDDWHGWDFYSNDNDPMDKHSHGTHVAGTIGAVGNNSLGVVGVNWSVSMVPIKVFSDSGETTTDALVKGIDYATKLGVFVTNNSWGSATYSDAIFASIQKAADAKVLFVAAAGNEGSNNDFTDTFPANYGLPNIISVASINRKDQLSSFSNYGSRKVDVAAPGEDIYSTLPGGLYGLKSGTSMASPHVTGALALLRSQFPTGEPLAIREKLLASSIPTATLTDKVNHGRINVGNAMEKDTTPPSVVTGFSVLATTLNTVSITWNLSGDDDTAGEATNYLIRMSSAPITTESQWTAAQEINVVDLKRADTIYTGTIANVPYNQGGFLTIRAVDNVGNISELAESQPFTLKTVDVLWSEDNGPSNQWDAFGTPWAITTINGLSVLSDSPGGLYGNSTDKSVVSKEIKLASSDLFLELRSKYQLEKDYDWGLLEVSIDGGTTWKEVGRVNGESDWTTTSYSLKAALGTATSFRLRVRLKSDQSLNYDGWDIDSLKILGQSN